MPQLVALYGELPRALAEEEIREARARIERGGRWLLGERNRDGAATRRARPAVRARRALGRGAQLPRGKPLLEESRAARISLARLAERLGEAEENNTEPLRRGPARGIPAPPSSGAGLIARGREAQWRPCRIGLTPQGVADWAARYRNLWEQRLISSRPACIR